MIALFLVVAALAGSLRPHAQQSQEAAPSGVRQASAANREDGNEILDGIAVQAGESLVTLSEFVRATKRYQARYPPSNAAEEERLRLQVLRDLATMRLEEQGGAELGLDQTQIERMTRADLQARRDKTGLEAYLAELQSQGKDALMEAADRQHEIRRIMWEFSAQGRAFANKRATRDHSIRPGELRGIYEENKERLAPPTVQLRWLIVSSESMGGAEAARASCADARERVLEGEDLALLVEERGAEFRDTRGLTPLVPPRNFRDPALVSFAEAAEIGALSDVLPLLNPETGEPDPRLGYQLAQLHDRVSPEVPVFSKPEVQRALRGFFTTQRRELVLGREREALHREAFTWVNPLLGIPAPGAASGATDPP